MQVIHRRLPEFVESAIQVFCQSAIGANLRACTVQRILAEPSGHVRLRLLHRLAVGVLGCEVVEERGSSGRPGLQGFGLGHPQPHALGETFSQATLVVGNAAEFLGQRLVGLDHLRQLRHAKINQVRHFVGGHLNVVVTLDADLFDARPKETQAILALYPAFVDGAVERLREVLDDVLTTDRGGQISHAGGASRALCIVNQRRIVRPRRPRVLHLAGHRLNFGIQRSEALRFRKFTGRNARSSGHPLFRR